MAFGFHSVTFKKWIISFSLAIILSFEIVT